MYVFILFNWQDNQFILGRAGNLVLTTGLSIDSIALTKG